MTQQASNGRTAPRSSAVPPRPRAPRRARTKRLAPYDSAWTDDGLVVSGVPRLFLFYLILKYDRRCGSVVDERGDGLRDMNGILGNEKRQKVDCGPSLDPGEER